MATSFRLSVEQLNRLSQLAKRLGVSKAQVVKQAIDKYYREQMEDSGRSALDRLLEAGFEPAPCEGSDLVTDLASDEVRQREIINAKLAKKRRH